MPWSQKTREFQTEGGDLQYLYVAEVKNLA